MPKPSAYVYAAFEQSVKRDFELCKVVFGAAVRCCRDVVKYFFTCSPQLTFEQISQILYAR